MVTAKTVSLPSSARTQPTKARTEASLRPAPPSRVRETATNGAASSSLGPRHPQTTHRATIAGSEAVLEALRNRASCNRSTVTLIRSYLGVSKPRLQVAGKATSPGGECIIHGEANSPRLPSAVANPSNYAKKVVNAVFGALNDMIDAKRQPRSETAARPGGTLQIQRTASSRSRTTASSSRSASSCSSLTSSVTSRSSSSQPGKKLRNSPSTLPDAALSVTFVLTECMEEALNYIVETSSDHGEKEGLAIAKAIAQYVGKLITLQMHAKATEGLICLRRCLSTRFKLHFTAEDESGLLLFPFSAHLDTMSHELQSVLLDAQCLALTSFSELISQDSLADLDVAFNKPAGPLHELCCLQQASMKCRGAVNVQAIDVAALSMERTLSRVWKRIVLPGDTWDLTIASLSLKLLLCASDTLPDAFWERASRLGVRYTSNASISDSGPVATGQSVTAEARSADSFLAVHKFYKDLLRRIEELPARGKGIDWRRGPSFIRFQDGWINLAKKAGDKASLDEIAAVIEDRKGISDSLSSSDGEAFLSRVTITFANTTLVLDAALEDASTFASISAHQSLTASEEALLSLSDRLEETSVVSLARCYRYIDQVRRRALTLIESNDQYIRAQPAIERLVALLKALMLFLERCITFLVKVDTKSSPPYLQMPQILDTFVQSARLLFVAEVEGGEDFLRRSATAVSAMPTASVPLEERAELLIEVANTYHTSGARLWSNKRLDLALPWLQRAVNLTEESDSLHTLASLGQTLTTERLALEVRRRDNCIRKLDHLAKAYQSTQQKRLALDTYETALMSVPTQHFETIARQARSLPVKHIFSSTPALALLASVAHNVMELHAFDFLSPQQPTTQEGIFARLIARGHSPDGVAALAEHCILMLDAHMVKEEALSALTSLIAQTLELYNPEMHPIRSARVKTRLMEAQILEGQRSAVKASSDIILNGEEVLKCLTRTNKAADADLAPFLPQYTATAHLLLALAYQHSGSSDGSEVKSVITSIRSASNLLQSYLIGHNTHTLADNRCLRASRKANTSATNNSSGTKGGPSTPPRKSQLASTSSPPVRSDSAHPDMDNIIRLCSLVEYAAEATSAYGHTLSSVELFTILKRLYQLALSGEEAYDAYTRCSAAIVRSHLLLNNLQPAGVVVQKLASVLKTSHPVISDDTRFRSLLVQAEYFCRSGDFEQSNTHYEEAIQLAQSIAPTGRRSGWQGVVAKCQASERQALAAEAFSFIALSQCELAQSLTAAVQAVRFSTRASFTLSNLMAAIGPKDGSSADSAVPSSDPASSDRTAGTVVRVAVPARRLASLALGCLYWRVSRLLFLAYLRCTDLFVFRGSALDAESFCGRAVELAASQSATLALTWALVQRADIRRRCGRREKGDADLAQSVALLGDTWIPEALSLALVQGDWESRACNRQLALTFYSAGQSSLRSLNRAFVELESTLPSPVAQFRKSSNDLPHKSSRSTLNIAPSIFPDTLCLLLRRQAWILHIMRRERESQDLLDQAANNHGGGSRMDELLVTGRIAHHRGVQQLRTQVNHIINLIPDAALSMPMYPAASKAIAATTKDATTHFTQAKLAYRDASVLGRLHGRALQVREAYTSLATVNTLQAVLESAIGAADTCALLDLSASVTLQREMVEAIDLKFARTVPTAEDSWLRLKSHDTKSGTVARQSLAPSQRKTISFPHLRGSDMRDFWERSRERHLGLKSPEAGTTLPSLPMSWTVVSITTAKEGGTLLLSRYGGARDPLLFSLPLDRHSRREGEEEEDLSFELASRELRSIVEASDACVRNAKGLKAMEARKEWWNQRRDLDKRLEQLMAAIETTWLGGFKSIFSRDLHPPRPVLDQLRTDLDRVINRHCFRNKKRQARLKLDDAVFDCLVSLSPTSTEDELEDLLHFFLDVYQFNGVPVAVDEIDFDELVVEVRSMLENFRSAIIQSGAGDHDRSKDRRDHTFLVLDKDTSQFPWETIPCLRGRPVSRIPSVAFLQDRLDLLRFVDGDDSAVMTIDRTKTFYILNPGGDLAQSEQRFGPWFEREHRRSSWNGIVGRPPVLNEFTDALARNDLVIYLGHSGGELYARPQEIRRLQRCAVTMLWGCSSGILRDQGDFDRSGTPNSYMQAGCPALVASLWDTTDRELDNVTQSVFTKLGLMTSEDIVVEGAARDRRQPQTCQRKGAAQRLVSIVEAVAEARNDCKLPYLTGASCVVYGIPVYFQT